MAINKAAVLVTVILVLAILPSCSAPAPAPKPPVVEPAPTPPQPAPVPAVTPPAPAPTPAPAPPVPAPVPVPPTPRAELALDPSRDLVGTWRGTGACYWIDGGNGQKIAKVTYDVTLVITGFNGRVPLGNLTMRDIKHENLGQANVPVQDYGPDQIRDGEAGDTRLYFRVDEWRWEFTFTTSLMSGQFTSRWPGQCDAGAFKLTRQR